MLKLRKRIRALIFIFLVIAVLIGIGIYILRTGDYGFARPVSDSERQNRQKLIAAAEKWLGADEGSIVHSQILEVYNSHQPLAQGYEVQPDDNWCAAFVSAAAIESGMTDCIPTECGCQRQIGLFQERNCWQEADDYVPLPGDIIYYCNTDRSLSGDCTGWSDHVGIVVGTWHGIIKVIEGNSGDTVRCRYLPINAPTIRGYAIPAY